MQTDPTGDAPEPDNPESDDVATDPATPDADDDTERSSAKVRPRRTVRRRAFQALTVAAVGIAALAMPTVYAQAVSWPHRHDVADAPSGTPVLVLGAGLQPDGSPSDFLAARLDVALELYRAGKAPQIVLSGARGEPQAMWKYLYVRGVPPDVLVKDDYGTDTYNSCARARLVFWLDSVILVTQAYHLPRAIALCRTFGLDASGVGDTAMRHHSPDVWWFGVVREGGANIKAAWNVVTGRDPDLTSQIPTIDDGANGSTP